MTELENDHWIANVNNRMEPHTYMYRSSIPIEPLQLFSLVIFISGIYGVQWHMGAYTQQQQRRTTWHPNWSTYACVCSLHLCNLIFTIHFMVNWQLSKQSFCWPVSHDHITGSSVQLIEVTRFFFKLMAEQVMDFHLIAGLSTVPNY